MQDALPAGADDGMRQLLAANPINRSLINSPMLPELTRDADGT